MTPEFDVSVIGAGPAGSAVARLLALRGYRVALVERSGFDEPRVGESFAPAIQPSLAAIGIWPEFMALGPLPSYGTRSHWGSDEVQVHSHMFNRWGCGWHVDRQAFDLMMARAACAAGAQLFCETTFVSFDYRRGRWKLEMRTSNSRTQLRHFGLHARVLVDATGRVACVARSMGAKRHLLDRLVATAVRFSNVDVGAQGYILVEAAPDGWWYSAPLPGGGMIAMLMTDSDLCRQSCPNSLKTWQAKLECAQATRARLASAIPDAPPRVFSAVSHRTTRSDYKRPWLAVGDAVLAVDPVSGSGVIRALKAAKLGAETAARMLNDDVEQVVEEHEAVNVARYASYLTERSAYYGLEQRWLTHPFWKRRTTSNALMLSRARLLRVAY